MVNFKMKVKLNRSYIDLMFRNFLCSFICFLSIWLFVWSSCNIKLDAIQLIRNPINGAPRITSTARRSLDSRSKLLIAVNQNWSQIIAEAGDHIAPDLPRLLCFTLTVREKNQHRRQAVVDTWGRRCDKLLMVVATKANHSDPDLEPAKLVEYPDGVQTIEVPLIEESRKQLWHKIIKAVRLIKSNFLDQYDWFIKTDDDSYLFVDELKRFLAQHSPQSPVYFGHRFKKYIKPQGYMSGGSGYVLSRRALELLVDDGLGKRLDVCHLQSGSVEDLEIGRCLDAVKVVAGDSRDSKGRPRFLAINPTYMLPSRQDDYIHWYEVFNFYGNPQFGPQCCSSNPIAFHYVEPRYMYLIDWLVYVVAKERQRTAGGD